MGRHFWTKNMGDKPQNKQPGCMWGALVQVFDVHLWHSNVRKMIRHSRTEDYTQRSRATRRRSLRARIRALITEEISKKLKGFSVKSSLQRTYSIHHLEALDDELSRISTDWNQPIIFFPGNLENSKTQALETTQQSELYDQKEETDVLDIFKVDKRLLAKHLQDADENIVNFTRSALGLTKAKLSKSRSFPLPDQRRKLKPVRLENKHKEAWSFPRGEPFQTLDQARAHRLDGTDCSLATSGELAADKEVKSGRIGEKRIYRRSSSLNESLDKYARMFESSLGTGAKLRPTKSLKLTNEYGYNAPAYFRRMQSLSNSGSYNSNLNSEVLAEGPSGNGSSLVAKDSGSDESNTKEDADKMTTNYSDISRRELLDELSILDSNIHLQETPSLAVDLQNSEGTVPFLLSRQSTFSDSYFVKHLLDQSGIAMDAYERKWHSSDQPLSPQLFELVETSWPHDPYQVDGYTGFYGCWHHQMLFDLVNQVLVDVYDRSLSYYPKALSSSCKVRPFSLGSQIIDDVSTSIGKLLDLKSEEKQSLHGMVARDLASDHDQWMNLQLESECTGLDIEDIIFEDLLEEEVIVCLRAC